MVGVSRQIVPQEVYVSLIVDLVLLSNFSQQVVLVIYCDVLCDLVWLKLKLVLWYLWSAAADQPPATVICLIRAKLCACSPKTCFGPNLVFGALLHIEGGTFPGGRQAPGVKRRGLTQKVETNNHTTRYSILLGCSRCFKHNHSACNTL